MTDIITHRGPDCEGHWKDGNIAVDKKSNRVE